MYDVITVGETMLAFSPVGANLTQASQFRTDSAGGESNVAANLAALGHRVAWASRLGNDPPGRRILFDLTLRQVDVSLVVFDSTAPTGLMLKDPSPAGSKVFYYRKESAASAMDAGFIEPGVLRNTRIIHSTGVTAALSPSCAGMIDHLVAKANAAGCLFSFDVNYRSALWEKSRAKKCLLEIAAKADIVFVGRDEAEALWGTNTAEDVRALLPEPQILVVKDADIGATLFEQDQNPVFAPAPAVTVVEPVGAGDAFAAGFLSGFLQGLDRAAALNLGHSSAARVLSTMGDLPERPIAPSPPAKIGTRRTVQ